MDSQDQLDKLAVVLMLMNVRTVHVQRVPFAQTFPEVIPVSVLTEYLVTHIRMVALGRTSPLAVTKNIRVQKEKIALAQTREMFVFAIKDTKETRQLVSVWTLTNVPNTVIELSVVSIPYAKICLAATNVNARRNSLAIPTLNAKNATVPNANVNHPINSLEEIVFCPIAKLAENVPMEQNVFPLLEVLATVPALRAIVHNPMVLAKM